MTISEYEELTGQTVTNASLVTAQIARTQVMLENMLGYTLDATLLDNNEYDEIGKAAGDCPCPDVDMDNLEAADPVVYAYRLFPFDRDDIYLGIDPATAVHAVKLVSDGITFKTFDPSEYRADMKRGISMFLERHRYWCSCVGYDCHCTQLAVDATWVIPPALLSLWADMVTYYSDVKRDVKRETLGTHSYEKFTKDVPQELDENAALLRMYAGPNGTAFPLPL